MGFIDWHKKDHYEDVLDYAKARREEQQKLQRDKEIRKSDQHISDILAAYKFAAD